MGHHSSTLESVMSKEFLLTTTPTKNVFLFLVGVAQTQLVIRTLVNTYRKSKVFVRCLTDYSDVGKDEFIQKGFRIRVPNREMPEII